MHFSDDDGDEFASPTIRSRVNASSFPSNSRSTVQQNVFQGAKRLPRSPFILPSTSAAKRLVKKSIKKLEFDAEELEEVPPPKAKDQFKDTSMMVQSLVEVVGRLVENMALPTKSIDPSPVVAHGPRTPAETEKYRPELTIIDRDGVSAFLSAYAEYQRRTGPHASVLHCVATASLSTLSRKLHLDGSVNIHESKYADSAVLIDALRALFPALSKFTLGQIFGRCAMDEGTWSHITESCVTREWNQAVTAYIQRMDYIRASDCTVREKATEPVLVHLLLVGLQPSWFRTVIKNLNPLTYNAATQDIADYQEYIESSSRFSVSGGGGKADFAGAAVSGNDRNNAADKRAPRPCSNCSSTSHTIGKCDKKCKRCPKADHVPRVCPQYLKFCAERDGARRKPTGGTKSAAAAAAAAAVTMESLAASLVALLDKKLSADDEVRLPKSGSVVAVGGTSAQSHHVYNNLDMTPQHHNSILADSGCTNTFINNKSYLDHYTHNTSHSVDRSVSVANGQLAQIDGSGTFLGMEADHVKSFDNSLISISQFTSLGNVCLFDATQMCGIVVSPAVQRLYDQIVTVAKRDNLIKLVATNIGGLYKTSYNQLKSLQHVHKQHTPHYCGIARYFTTEFKSLKELVTYFHHAWGHMSKSDMVTAIKNGLYKNIPEELTVTAVNKHFPLCVACTKGNLTMVPAVHQASPKNTAIGEEWEVDIKGPWTGADGKQVLTFSGCSYTLTFRDVVSKKLIGYVMKHKNNLVTYIDKFIRYVSSKGFKVRILRTDNELLSLDIRDCCMEEQIELQSCVPYEHNQIGNVERVHQSIENAIVKMLHDKPHLSDKYWGMAYHYCLFTMNLQPIPSLDNQCAHTLWEKKPLDLQNQPILPFGTIVMAHIPVKLQHALGGRSMETIAVGCAPGYKAGILLFNPRTKKYLVRRSFKAFGSTAPVSPVYNVAIEYEALEHITDIDAELDHTADSSAVVPTSVPAVPTPRSAVSQKTDNYFAVLDEGDDDELPTDVVDAEDVPRLVDVEDGDDEAPAVRKSSRVRKPNPKYSNFADIRCRAIGDQWNSVLRKEAAKAKKFAHAVASTEKFETIEVPQNYAKALYTQYADNWICAKDKEFSSFRNMKTYAQPRMPIDQIPKDKIIDARIVLDVCYNPDGSLKKFKFRLCARGDQLKKKKTSKDGSVDENDLYDALRNNNYAGTVKAESVRILLSIAAELDLEIESWDVGTAFLHPELKPDEEIYMRRPPGLTDQDMPKVVQLKKCIYGLPQASAYFREHSDKELKKIGFKPTVSDPQVYTQFRKDGFIFVSTHVDDFGVIGTSLGLLAEVKAELSKVYELSTAPEMTYYLGILITRDRANRTIFMSQPKYVDEMLKEYGIAADCPDVSTPMATNYDAMGTGSQRGKSATPKQAKMYMRKVGSLLYLAIQTRPDILFPVTMLSRYCKSPTEVDLLAVDRVLHYISHTQELGLTLFSGEGIVLYATVDASYACHKDMKSHTGCTLHIGRQSASILTITKKQPITADSSTVAEYIGAHLAAKQILWARNFLEELGFPQKGPTTLFEDNKSTISLIQNSGNGSHTKHIALRYAFIREQVRLGFIKMEHLSTENMTSDMLTKVNGPAIYLHLRPKLLGNKRFAAAVRKAAAVRRSEALRAALRFLPPGLSYPTQVK